MNKAFATLEAADGRAIATEPCRVRWNDDKGVLFACASFDAAAARGAAPVLYQVGASFRVRQSLPAFDAAGDAVTFELPITLEGDDAGAVS